MSKFKASIYTSKDLEKSGKDKTGAKYNNYFSF